MRHGHHREGADEPGRGGGRGRRIWRGDLGDKSERQRPKTLEKGHTHPAVAIYSQRLGPRVGRWACGPEREQRPAPKGPKLGGCIGERTGTPDGPPALTEGGAGPTSPAGPSVQVGRPRLARADYSHASRVSLGRGGCSAGAPMAYGDWEEGLAGRQGEAGGWPSTREPAGPRKPVKRVRLRLHRATRCQSRSTKILG